MSISSLVTTKSLTILCLTFDVGIRIMCFHFLKIPCVVAALPFPVVRTKFTLIEVLVQEKRRIQTSNFNLAFSEFKENTSVIHVLDEVESLFNSTSCCDNVELCVALWPIIANMCWHNIWNSIHKTKQKIACHSQNFLSQPLTSQASHYLFIQESLDKVCNFQHSIIFL